MGVVERRRLLDGAWLVFCIAASSVWCVSASARLGATFDEPTYVRLGLESWRAGTSRRLLDLGTMPLPVHSHTLPLYLWERWRGEPFDADRDLERLLPVARVAALPFWWLLLFYGWRAGRQMAGPWGGRLALAFLACEPNLLAHAALATTDVPVTGCLLALLLHFRLGRDGPWWRRVGVPAFWLALAVLCKASGLVFALIGLAVVEIEYRASLTEVGAGWRRRLRGAIAALGGRGFPRDLFQAGALGLAAVFVYCGTDGDVSPSFVAWARDLPEGPARSALAWFAEHLRIFSNAGVALVRQVRHNVQGHGVFLLEQVARRAIWYYFPLALSIKATVPLLALPLVVAGLYPGALRNWACRVALALLLFSLVCRVQIGVRLMLPLIGLAAVGLAAALVRAWQALPPCRVRQLLTGSAALGAAWMAWSALHVWPDGLCFTNELWGGTANGYRRLSDSNYDWGQGLKELARWQRQQRVTDLDVLYYGMDTALTRLPMHRLPYDLVRHDDPVELADRLRGRTLAVGTSILFGSVSELPFLKPAVSCLRRLEPVDRTSTFLIYRFPPAPGQAAAAGARAPGADAR
jgi:hypothetical protein